MKKIRYKYTKLFPTNENVEEIFIKEVILTINESGLYDIDFAITENREEENGEFKKIIYNKNYIDTNDLTYVEDLIDNKYILDYFNPSFSSIWIIYKWDEIEGNWKILHRYGE